MTIVAVPIPLKSNPANKDGCEFWFCEVPVAIVLFTELVGVWYKSSMNIAILYLYRSNVKAELELVYKPLFKINK